MAPRSSQRGGSRGARQRGRRGGRSARDVPRGATPRPAGPRRPGGEGSAEGFEATEWLGGRFELPFQMLEETSGQPMVPELVLWLELPSGLIVGQEMLSPGDPGEEEGAVSRGFLRRVGARHRTGSEPALARVLRRALKSPMAGPPRRPLRVRLAEATGAAERAAVQAALGAATPVEREPVPELEALMEGLAAALADEGEVEDDGAGYLESGRLPAACMDSFFEAGAELYVSAPWERVDSEQVVRVDVPVLAAEGVCVSVVSEAEGGPGLLVCPSADDWEAFLAEMEEPTEVAWGPPAIAGQWMAFSFHEGGSLPETHRTEAEQHGWPRAGPDAWPMLTRGGPMGVEPLEERDVRLAAACARAVAELVGRHPEVFAAAPGEAVEPVSVWIPDSEVERVLVTAPYDAFDLFEEPEHGADPAVAPAPGDAPFAADAPAHSMGRTPILTDTLPADVAAAPAPAATAPAGTRRRVGRNDRCPCGSGRKYKRCCLAEDEARASAEGAGAATAAAGRHPLHDVDNRMVERLVRWVQPRFEEAWLAHLEDFRVPSAATPLAAPWAVYGYPVEGRTVLERYLEAEGRHLSAAERAWAAAQQRAWLSVWEVAEVRPGAEVTLRDTLSHEERTVQDGRASAALHVHDAILGRVVDCEGVSLLCGVHPQPLPPRPAADLVRRARGRLGRKRAVPVGRLRDPEFARYLIRRWEEDVHALVHAPLPELRNASGDAILFTTDHFAIRPGARAEVEAALVTLPGVDPPDPEGPPVWVFLGAEESGGGVRGRSVLGHAEIANRTLCVKANSASRADELRELVEAACGERVRHRAREHVDPLSEARSQDPVPPLPEQSAEQQQLVLDFKRQHYADWPDQPLPALGGRTAREAAQTAEGRRAVDLLLKDMQNMEARMADEGPVYDFSWIRRELGLEDPGG